MAAAGSDVSGVPQANNLPYLWPLLLAAHRPQPVRIADAQRRSQTHAQAQTLAVCRKPTIYPTCGRFCWLPTALSLSEIKRKTLSKSVLRSNDCYFDGFMCPLLLAAPVACNDTTSTQAASNCCQ
eukprot:CAMPEP_0172777242 /NCGR_PEP_ID=MMETSP1074-20121228/201301_1 /TAXON_ID=2916 /ORGANISM="Ceratium fusus, Strain PA161109" /LENGTH=124 /DNA_ID=CAMNT_0013614155 /DNA_START=232 /DNA_END=606 /DNA_ORIENTATION=-